MPILPFQLTPKRIEVKLNNIQYRRYNGVGIVDPIINSKLAIATMKKQQRQQAIVQQTAKNLEFDFSIASSDVGCTGIVTIVKLFFSQNRWRLHQ